MTGISLARGKASGSTVELEILIESRMLIQGGSGSGKSTLARRLLEQTSGQIQQIIIDPEGEFSTLRSIGDYLLCSHEGDVPTEHKSASLLAKKIRETGVSAIVDIYELKPMERQAFVARFLEGLIAAPKKYWRDCLVFIDETHVFAPQARTSDSLIAVQDLAARGRKRKLGLICATQRLSKLHKDVAAECRNRLIGQTGLKNDLRSAAEEMGLSYAETREALLMLKPGQFWSFGPALAPEYTLFQGAQTKTKAATADTPPGHASANLSKVIESLSDLPKQAAKAAQTLVDLKTENTTLKRNNTRLQRVAESTGIPEAEVQRRIRQAVAAVPVTTGSPISSEKITRLAEQIIAHAKSTDVKHRTPAITRTPVIPTAKPNGHDISGTLARGEQKVLIAIAQHGNGVDREQVTILTGYKTSTRNAYIQRLQVSGLINIGPPITATDAGFDALPHGFTPLPTGEALRDYWLNKLPAGERACLEPVIEAFPQSVSRDHISIETGYKTSTRNAYIQRLQTRKLVTIRSGEVVAHYQLFATEKEL